jgi:hypothetical protein
MNLELIVGFRHIGLTDDPAADRSRESTAVTTAARRDGHRHIYCNGCDLAPATDCSREATAVATAARHARHTFNLICTIRQYEVHVFFVATCRNRLTVQSRSGMSPHQKSRCKNSGELQLHVGYDCRDGVERCEWMCGKCVSVEHGGNS